MLPVSAIPRPTNHRVLVRLRIASSTKCRSSRPSFQRPALLRLSGCSRSSICSTLSATSTSRCTRRTITTGAATAWLLNLGGQRTQNLHAYWDTAVVEASGTDPARVAIELRANVTPAQRQQWQQGSPSDWTQEAFHVARSTAYTIGSPPSCQQDATPIPLPPGYSKRAQAAAAVQLERAGVRLGVVLNRALAAVPVRLLHTRRDEHGDGNGST